MGIKGNMSESDFSELKNALNNGSQLQGTMKTSEQPNGGSSTEKIKIRMGEGKMLT